MQRRINEEMCIFDLDGTLDLTDRGLNAKIVRLTKEGIVFVTATGRTNRYVTETCKQNHLIQPKFIIADNGGTIYDNKNNVYLMQKILELDIRERLMQEYMRLGGKIEDIRYTDGNNVYAVDSEDVRTYYERENIIEYLKGENLIGNIMSSNDITKVTLVGSKTLIKKLQEFIKQTQMSCGTHIGVTKFPTRDRKNYRLDITDGRTSKGEAVKRLTEEFGTRVFTCIGNGLNDYSMFKYAIDTNQRVVIVKNKRRGMLTMESEELIRAVESYAKSVRRQDNVTIADFPINSQVDRILETQTVKERRNEFIGSLRCDIGTKSDEGQLPINQPIVKTKKPKEH